MSRQLAEEYVERGAALLDRKAPPGWEHRIDPAIFDIRHGCRCALGQVYAPARAYGQNGYTVGRSILGLNADALTLHGFLPDPPDATEVELDEAWLSLLKRRHNLGVFSDTAEP